VFLFTLQVDYLVICHTIVSYVYRRRVEWRVSCVEHVTINIERRQTFGGAIVGMRFDLICPIVRKSEIMIGFVNGR
jgi:hypothetical protein